MATATGSITEQGDTPHQQVNYKFPNANLGKRNRAGGEDVMSLINEGCGVTAPIACYGPDLTRLSPSVFGNSLKNYHPFRNGY